jgi:hypothetical protein
MSRKLGLNDVEALLLKYGAKDMMKNDQDSSASGM